VTHGHVFVNELTNKIDLYSSATWLSIMIDFVTNVDYVYKINFMPNGLPPMFIGIN
jgi:hypothetical protein